MSEERIIFAVCVIKADARCQHAVFLKNKIVYITHMYIQKIEQFTASSRTHRTRRGAGITALAQTIVTYIQKLFIANNLRGESVAVRRLHVL